MIKNKIAFLAELSVVLYPLLALIGHSKVFTNSTCIFLAIRVREENRTPFPS